VEVLNGNQNSSVATKEGDWQFSIAIKANQKNLVAQG
jgi:hypothetical protein